MNTKNIYKKMKQQETADRKIWTLENQDEIPTEIVHKVSDELDNLIPALKSFYSVCYDCDFDPELAHDILKGAGSLAIDSMLAEKLTDMLEEMVKE